MAKTKSPRYRKKNGNNATKSSARAIPGNAPATGGHAGAAAAKGGKKRHEPAAAASSARRDKEFHYLPTERRSLLPTLFFQSATQPYRLVQRDWKRELPHLFAVFFMVLLLYAFTTPHTVTLEDDGLFIANLKFFGVAHPPGYPVHTFLGGLFYHLLPFGVPAFKGHMFSGFAGAVACAAIYACVVMLLNGRVFGYLAGLAYGASKTFWSQAIIAEVYTLNAMFFFIVLAMCIAYASHVGRSGRLHRRLLYIIAFTYGVAAANHYPILLLGSTGLALLVFSQLRNILPNIPQGVFLLLGGLVPPYVWMVWRSHTITPANFYGPIETWDQFWFYFLRSGYSGVDKQANVGWDDKLVFAKSLGDDMLWQFTPLGFVFVVLGFFVMARSRYNWMWLSLATSWFTSSVILIYLLDFKATFIWLAAFRVYHLLAFGIMAIWLAIGAAWFVDKLRFMPFILRRQIGLLLVPAVVVGSVYAHWDINYRHDYRWAHDLALAKINSIEADAILFAFDDLDLPVGYLHYVENVRPDLTVYNDQGLVYGNRLYSPLLPDFPPANNPSARSKSAILRKLMETTERPIYYHPQRRNMYQHSRYGSDFTGFLRRVNRENSQERIILSEALLQWLDKNIGIADEITDLWTKQQHYSTVAQLINAIMLGLSNGYPVDERWQEVIDRARDKNAMTRLFTNQQNLHQMSEEELKKELAWTREFDVNQEELFSPGNKSSFYLLQAALVERLEDGKDAPGYEEALRKGAGYVKEAKDNPSLSPLLDLLFQREKYCEFIGLMERYYPSTDKMPVALLRQLRQARQKGDC